MRRLAIVGLLCALPLAGSAAAVPGEAGMRDPGMKTEKSEKGMPPAGSVVPHTTMTLASIDAGKAWCAGLTDMASKPGAWDMAHAQTYMQQIRSDIDQANTHLQHLAPFAQGREDRSKDLRQAGDYLGRAQQVLGGMSDAPPDIVASRGKDLCKDLDSAKSHVGELAKKLGAEGKLRNL